MAMMSFLVNDGGTGGPIVRITITEQANGTLLFQITEEGNIVGDLRGLFFDVANESLIGTLSANGGPLLTEFMQGNDTVKDLGQGANMQGYLGSDGGYDAGVEMGTAGMAKDDIQAFSFILNSTLRPLTLADFSGVDFGLRLTSVGLVNGTRDGSSKLTENTLHVVAPVIDSVVVDENASASGNVLANDRVGLSPADVLTVTDWVLNGITYAPETVIALPILRAPQSPSMRMDPMLWMH